MIATDGRKTQGHVDADCIEPFRLMPDQVFELRALKVPTGRGRPATCSGYFDDVAKMVEAANRLDCRRAQAVYLVLNPINPGLLARSANRITDYAEATTSDGDILRRAWLPIDIDHSGRPAGVSATDNEIAEAKTVMAAVRNFMVATFDAEPGIESFSGNGWHLLYRLDEGVTTEGTETIKRFLTTLATRFNSAAAKVDTSVFNPARIWKLPGTHARKGDSTEDRPHRLAELLEHRPEAKILGTSELKVWLDANAPKPEAPKSSSRKPVKNKGIAESVETLTAYLVEHGVKVKGTKPLADGGAAIHIDCPIHPEHGNNCTDTSVFWRPTGVGFKCYHDSCNGNDWKACRRAIDPDYGDDPHDDYQRHTSGADANDDADPVARASAGKPYMRTDLGNAERFAAMYGDRVRYVAGPGWFAWDEKRWMHDQTGKVWRLFTSCVKNIYREAIACSEAAASEADGEKAAAFKDHAVELNKWAFASQSRTKIEAMEKLARFQKGLAVVVDEMDADPFLLNCETGTIDLHNGELHPHRPADLITKLAPTEFNATASAVHFLEFLSQIFDGDKQMMEFVRRACGNACIGRQDEHVFHVLHGTGANGKSTLLEIIGAVLGDYAGKAAEELLIQQKHRGHPTEVADLRGKRFVWSFESSEGATLDEARVKALTGGDRLKARFMNKDFFEFPASHTLFFGTNHKPAIRGNDAGIWRRVKLWPFDQSFTGDREDINLKAKLLKEASGILIWLVRGAIDSQKPDRLAEPEAVKAATAEYRHEEDRFGQWLEERCEINEAYSARTSDLYTNYRGYCDAGGMKPLSIVKFSKALETRGFYRDDAKRHTLFFGLRVAYSGL